MWIYHLSPGINLLRNRLSKTVDNVDDIWQYKFHHLSKLFQSSVIWEKIIGKTWIVFKDENKSTKSIETSTLLHQTYIPTFLWKDK